MASREGYCGAVTEGAGVGGELRAVEVEEGNVEGSIARGRTLRKGLGDSKGAGLVVPHKSGGPDVASLVRESLAVVLDEGKKGVGPGVNADFE